MLRPLLVNAKDFHFSLLSEPRGLRHSTPGVRAGAWRLLQPQALISILLRVFSCGLCHIQGKEITIPLSHKSQSQKPLPKDVAGNWLSSRCQLYPCTTLIASIFKSQPCSLVWEKLDGLATGPASCMCDLCSCTGLHTEFNTLLCCFCLEILSTFCTRGPIFSFCIGPTNRAAGLTCISTHLPLASIAPESRCQH